MASWWLGNRQGYFFGASGFIAKPGKTSTNIFSFQALFRINISIPFRTVDD